MQTRCVKRRGKSGWFTLEEKRKDGWIQSALPVTRALGNIWVRVGWVTRRKNTPLLPLRRTFQGKITLHLQPTVSSDPHTHTHIHDIIPNITKFMMQLWRYLVSHGLGGHIAEALTRWTILQWGLESMGRHVDNTNTFKTEGCSENTL